MKLLQLIVSPEFQEALSFLITSRALPKTKFSTQPPETEPIISWSLLIAIMLPTGLGLEPQVSITFAIATSLLLFNHCKILIYL